MVGGKQQLDISNLAGDDVEAGCCGRMFNTTTHSSLRWSVSFCSIRCVLALKFGGEARIHEILKTRKFFLVIPHRSVSIRLLTVFKYFLSLNLGNHLETHTNRSKDDPIH